MKVQVKLILTQNQAISRGFNWEYPRFTRGGRFLLGIFVPVGKTIWFFQEPTDISRSRCNGFQTTVREFKPGLVPLHTESQT